MTEYCLEMKKAPQKNVISSEKKSKNQSKKMKKVLWIKLESLTPFPENPRVHDDKQINAICTSIKSFGFIQPILVDEDNVILAGHGRYEAAKRLELKLVPVIKVKNLTKKLKNAYVIADNKIAEGSHWDKDALAKQFKNMIDIDFNVEITGFSTAEADILIDGLVELEAEDSGDPRPVDMDSPPVSRLGDLWKLGDNHYLLCGSALKNESYRILMQGKVAQMIFTDPPYNVPVDRHIPAYDLIRTCVTRVKISVNQIAIQLNPAGFPKLVKKYLSLDISGIEGECEVAVSYKTGKARSGAVVIKSEADSGDIFDIPAANLKKLVQGVIWRDEHFSGKSIVEIARRENCSDAYVGKCILQSFEFPQTV